MIKAYDKAVASFKVKYVAPYSVFVSILPNRALTVAFLSQSALKGEEDPQASKENPPGKKRKNSKKNQSRKRSNAPPEKEVGN